MPAAGAAGAAAALAGPRFRDLRLLPRPALGLALAAVLAVVVLSPCGLRVRHERARRSYRSRGARDTAAPPAPPALARTRTAAVTEAGPVRRADRRRETAVIADVDDRAAERPPAACTGAPKPWDAALPPLDPPEPIELEPIGAPPMRVAQLEVERLSIDPLEVDALDGSEEE